MKLAPPPPKKKKPIRIAPPQFSNYTIKRNLTKI
jgi:hypothetical protein